MKFIGESSLFPLSYYSWSTDNIILYHFSDVVIIPHSTILSNFLNSIFINGRPFLFSNYVYVTVNHSFLVSLPKKKVFPNRKKVHLCFPIARSSFSSVLNKYYIFFINSPFIIFFTQKKHSRQKIACCALFVSFAIEMVKERGPMG